MSKPTPHHPATVSNELFELLLAEHAATTRPRLDRLWRYYRNPLKYGPSAQGRRSCAQAEGLPARLTHAPASAAREVVIENDIAWRIHALVDFMFGQPLVIQSLAPTPGTAPGNSGGNSRGSSGGSVPKNATKKTSGSLSQDRLDSLGQSTIPKTNATSNTANRAAKITQFLRTAFRDNGGEGFFQDMALLGSVYGHVDILVRSQPTTSPNASPIRLDLIEAPRAIPVLNPGDYRQLDAYLINHPQLTHDLDSQPLLNRILHRTSSARRKTVDRTEVWTAESFQTFISTPQAAGKKRALIDSGVNRLGRIPVVHIQNLAQPFFYEGLSDVEALISLQDELNTRLSDRANRVTFQSFKMYLGKGIDGFTDRPVGPGQMWSTDNPDAAIHEFGGDASTPSEDTHIREIREAMDKASGVPPIAAGVIGGKTGNLSSENAIRIVLLGLLARIEKKRLTYGNGIERVCELMLHAADVTGAFPNTPDERRVRLDWPTPFPDSEAQQLKNALAKKDLGVPLGQLLAELGYDDCPGHT